MPKEIRFISLPVLFVVFSLSFQVFITFGALRQWMWACFSRWTLSDSEVHPVDPLVSAQRILNHNSTDDGALHNYIMK